MDFPYVQANRRDRADSALDRHLNDVMGMVDGTRPMTQVRYGVLRHLERVRHHFLLEVDAAQASAVARWAQAANAIVMYRHDGILRAPDGKVLVDPASDDHDRGAQLPYPTDAIARRTTSTAQLAERGIVVMPELPPRVSEVEVELREPRHVAARILALFVCAVRAESLATGDPIPGDELRARLPLAFPALSPKEAAFLASASPAGQEIIDHAWGYEAIAPLAWSLGVIDRIPFPATIVDARKVAETMLALKGDEFLASARLRPTAELLDLLDVTYRVHWAATEARVKQRALPGVEAGVVAERHRALNWLTRFGDVDWDDVGTHT
ncbi:MAG TPA: DUF4272 domain-containing protein [Kofleriaceae bacterium]|jgi:hypothetical protein